MIAYSVLQALAKRNPESMVEVVFKNDKGILRDLSVWCEATGNKLVASEFSEDAKEMRALIQKGSKIEGRGSEVDSSMRVGGRKHVCLLISTADLEALVLPLDKALAAAVMGMQVHVCFEGAGVRILKSGYRPTVSGFFGRIFTSRVEADIKVGNGCPLPSAAIQMLEELGAQFYVCGPSLERYGVGEEHLLVNSVTLASMVTWVDLMASSDVNFFTKAVFESA